MYIVVIGLCRLLGSFLGVFLQLMIALAVLSLATWNPADPSPSHANVNEIRNLLGFWGAFYADLNMRFLGFSALIALIPPFFWGLFLSLQQTIHRFFCRFFCWIASIILSGIALSFLPLSARWPKTIAVGQGGVLGDKFASFFSALPDIFPDMITKSILVSIFVILSCFLTAYASCFFGKNGPFNQSDRKFSKKSIKIRNRKKKSIQKARKIFSSLQLASVFLGRLMHFTMRFRFMFLQYICQNKKKMSELHNMQKESPYDLEESISETANRKYFYPRLNHFELPPVSCLATPKKMANCEEISRRTIAYNIKILTQVLEDFGIKGEIISVRTGPVVTLYELEPAPGIKSARVISLSSDIARSMRATSARIAVISGRNVIGIELPNPIRKTVFLREILEAKPFQETHIKLALVLGKNIAGETFVADLTKMPHLLIAGTTGSGKSVAINTMILSILYRMTPEECRIIMIDPKVLELSIYNGIPHLLTPVITDSSQALVALKWAVREMEERYRNMAKLGVRNIDGFNERIRTIKKQKKTLSRTVQTGFDKKTGKPIFETEKLSWVPIPYILIIIDEIADLMIIAGKEIEGTVQRLAQMARAAGIHIIIATQRPSVDVITGTIKANFPTRISFQVTSKIDSRTILGVQGAEQLLGQGDMLFMMGGGRIQRIHAPFVGDEDIEKVVRYLKTQGLPKYLSVILKED